MSAAGEDDDLYADLYGNNEGPSNDDETRKEFEDSLRSEQQEQHGPSERRESLDKSADAPSAASATAAPAAATGGGGGSGGATAGSTTESSKFPLPPTPAASSNGGANGAQGADQQQQPSSSSYSSAVAAQFASYNQTPDQERIRRADADQQSEKPKTGRIAPHEMPEEGKMFVGGLNWDTTEEGLKRYFSQFGQVNACTIMRDTVTGRSRGFGFLTFEDPKAVNTVMVREHYLDGKIIDPKRAIPRPDSARSLKVFVGGLPQSITTDSFRTFFSAYGKIMDSTLMIDRETGRPRGFGFVTFETDEAVEKLLREGTVTIDGKMVEVKRATNRNRDQDSGARRGDVGGVGGGYGASGQTGGMQGGYGQGGIGAGAAGGQTGAQGPQMFGQAGGMTSFDPQAMAAMYQRMGWGTGHWNPAMMWNMMGDGANGGWGGMQGMAGMPGGGMMGQQQQQGMGGMMMPSMQPGGAGGMGMPMGMAGAHNPAFAGNPMGSAAMSPPTPAGGAGRSITFGAGPMAGTVMPNSSPHTAPMAATAGAGRGNSPAGRPRDPPKGPAGAAMNPPPGPAAMRGGAAAAAGPGPQRSTHRAGGFHPYDRPRR